MNTKSLIIAATTLVLATGAALAGPGGITTKSGILVDANQMTLYTFDKDEAGKSNCYDGCAKKWPPVAAKSGAMAEGDYSVVSRKDGTAQWAYKGQPLYLWVNDKKPGDKTGDKVGGVWHIVAE
jgi:predicted lipoprotein with Yx(FWY)xxD motif